MSESCDVLVVGAGIIGLAVARVLAMQGREVLILEKHEMIGFETSSRHSEVIHAGIYYPTGSNKAQMCVRGKHLLYQYCDEYRVPYSRIGKIIVATTERQLATLCQYQNQALANGAGQLTWLDRERVRDLEPSVDCIAGVFSPTTGIIDSHAYMLSLVGDIESNAGMIAFNTEVESVSYSNELIVTSGGLKLCPRLLINSAGLWAPTFSRQLGRKQQAYFAKGHYYTLSGSSPFKHLIYPIAESGGLGVHVTLDLSGQARFGPDVEWIESVDYGFSYTNKHRFVEAVRRYFPELDEKKLVAGYTGIRPKLVPKGQPAGDFVINGPQETGIPGYVELLGIESPGLTASLAIAERVAELVS